MDYVRSLLPHFQHFWNQFRRMLQIGIHDNDRSTGGEFETGGQGSLMTKIAGKMQNLDSGVLGMKFLQHFPSIVGASIIHEHDFPSVRQPVEFGNNGMDERADSLGFIEHRCHNGDNRRYQSSVNLGKLVKLGEGGG